MSICYVLVQVWACPQTRVCCLNGPLFTVATPEDQEITFVQGEVCASETNAILTTASTQCRSDEWRCQECIDHR